MAKMTLSIRNAQLPNARMRSPIHSDSSFGCSINAPMAMKPAMNRTTAASRMAS